MIVSFPGSWENRFRFPNLLEKAFSEFSYELQVELNMVTPNDSPSPPPTTPSPTPTAPLKNNQYKKFNLTGILPKKKSSAPPNQSNSIIKKSKSEKSKKSCKEEVIRDTTNQNTTNQKNQSKTK